MLLWWVLKLFCLHLVKSLGQSAECGCLFLQHSCPSVCTLPAFSAFTGLDPTVL